MRKKLAFGSIVLLILVALQAARTAAEEQPPEVTLEGTVVDLHCYVTHGIHDAGHTACANACIARGVPAGFHSQDGTLYVLFEEKPFSVKERVANFADVPATVRGRVSVRNGVKGIQISSIERKKA